MFSEKTQAIGQEYTARHGERAGVFGDKPYGNYGLWARKGMQIDDACAALTEAVAERAGMTRGDRVLEVGCGYGAATLHYTLLHEPASVVGIDVSDVRLEEARAYLSENGVSERVNLRLGDAAALDFDAGSFDRVLAIECALHFDTREKFFHE
ncbi:MAG: class I SAM-dependent methyltransferase, partial [Deltaproteobacteria bacterium]|nr:class I SAM-dependent methyltransferase [Deltaproteobacteria bacterium]